MTPPDEEAFPELIGRISRHAGLSLDGYKDKCLRRRIAVRMRACGVQSYQEYQELLERDAAEDARLKDTITINVTQLLPQRRNLEPGAQSSSPRAARRTVGRRSEHGVPGAPPAKKRTPSPC